MEKNILTAFGPRKKILTARELFTVLIYFAVALTSHKNKIWLIFPKIKKNKKMSLLISWSSIFLQIKIFLIFLKIYN